MNLTIKERVERGTETLDRLVPGWEGKIDVKHLDINYDESCVLAQLYGKYSTGRQALNDLGSTSSPQRLGFIAFGRDAHEWGTQYQELTAAWKRAIRERRARRTGLATVAARERVLEPA